MPGPYSFGRNSSRELGTVHHDLQLVAHRAILVFDFSVEQGRRTIDEQIRNIRKKVSKTIDSRHIPRQSDGVYDPSLPGDAFDLIPFTKGVNPWPLDSESSLTRERKKGRFYMMQGAVLMAAQFEGVDIIQGVDWDRDGDVFDQSFDDLPHVQRRREPWPRLVLPKELLELANEALVSRGLPEYKNP